MLLLFSMHSKSYSRMLRYICINQVMEQWCRISGDYVVFMAAELSSMRKRKAGGIMTHLSLAACEWFLIFLLFVDAVFSYFVREFAKYCELQTPCHLCSRLDRVLGEKKLGCRWSLVCSSHKKEISSLVFCSIHGELADFRGMCEECFKSIAMQNDSECKLIVGKLWVDVERSSGSRICSCCNEIWLAARSDDESLGGYKANVEPPVSHVLGCRRFSRREGMKRLRDKLTASMRQRTLSRVGYTEFKLSSDSEPESPLPEAGGGDGDSSSSGDNHTRPERGVEFGKRDRLEMPVSSVISEKQTHRCSEINYPSSSEFSLAESQLRGSLRWTKDVVSVDRVSQPPDVGSLDASAESSNVSSDSIYIVPSASSTLRITKKSIYIEKTCERVDISDSMNIEEATAGSSSDDSTCSSHSYSRNLCAENMNWTEQDTKSMSQACKPEVCILLKDAGPGPHNEHEKSRKYEDCSSQSLPLAVSLKRNDSSYESLDGFYVSDVEGESIIDQLRRQIEHDQSCMKSLCKELEEERNAADIAANQAMAMITRLQEEKAEAEMEAVQYMRLMELQAEYDMESLERDLLSEKEKELHELQTELDFYRNNFCDGRDETSFLENDAATGTSGDSESAQFSKANGKFSSEFGDEKLCVSLSLKKLVKNLYKDYCNENVEGAPNGLDFYKIKDDDFEHNGSSVSKGTPAHYYESKLHDRLEELEAGPNSIKYVSNLHQNREDGLQLVQDIAHQLQKSQ